MKTSKHNKFIVWTLLLLLIFSFGSTKKAQATTESETQSSSNFSILPIFPENQTNTGLSYFDLMMSPSQQQSITIDITNTSADPVSLDLDYNSAKTNRSGGIEYGEYNIENDASLVNDFVDIVTGPDTIEVPGGGVTQLELDIQMPAEAYDGVIAGGITLTPAESDTSESSAEGGSRVENIYAYSISVLLRENETELLPDLQYRTAYAGNQNYRNTVYVSLSNVIATYVEGLTIDAQITQSGSEDVLWESRSTAMRMAPNSYINYPVSMNGDRMTPGIYTAHVTAYAGGQTWEFTEDFEITQEEADENNQLDVGLVQDRGLDWRLVAAIVAGVVVVLGLAFLVFRRIKKNKKKQANEEKSVKQKKKKRKE
ncbi:DUF916 and DUF3324 domain-containing protein [Enterococcus sp. HY326]|uniref:DUF916 and DUF3324 domain-containing protein n=1 Tax=Enterococcus sp. HY326 TaxID=2971265 RepID=UPI0022408CBF|nr:DUF916 and DUF3324 domain-containing protein [Enterococcus sp. HY326]